jgi:hypothetical protein
MWNGEDLLKAIILTQIERMILWFLRIQIRRIEKKIEIKIQELEKKREQQYIKEMKLTQQFVNGESNE